MHPSTAQKIQEWALAYNCVLVFFLWLNNNTDLIGQVRIGSLYFIDISDWLVKNGSNIGTFLLAYAAFIGIDAWKHKIKIERAIELADDMHHHSIAFTQSLKSTVIFLQVFILELIQESSVENLTVRLESIQKEMDESFKRMVDMEVAVNKAVFMQLPASNKYFRILTVLLNMRTNVFHTIKLFELLEADPDNFALQNQLKAVEISKWLNTLNEGETQMSNAMNSMYTNLLK